MLPDLSAYTARVLPGLLSVAVCFTLVRPGRDPLLRIALLILGFLLLRDAMTPAGLWRLGAAGPVPWLRFTSDGRVLVILGVATVAVTALVLRADRELSALVRWGRPDLPTLGWGLGGGLLAAAPVLLLAVFQPLSERGGPVSPAVLPALAFFALAGNLAEEVLFRGMLQEHLERRHGPVRAALLSGLLFAACHSFLASTVTDTGRPLLLFTLHEGLICAFLRNTRGVAAAALAHGLAVFLLGSGLF
ncbi:CPBP family intramembrane metalloprotease [Streptomyces carminius]|uniref:CPBP family intramembrane metalloprotease n=1 Tax=Streptomyces carminius TaxID=2665496 RepID=A0A2M8LTY6_9ACTN|nr:type II CAAX endopeptidase family protein [Streptomyces carminius]PJE95389.1 CPBP family intramembrane metalloprotease [Streptomyces carminius]